MKRKFSKASFCFLIIAWLIICTTYGLEKQLGTLATNLNQLAIALKKPTIATAPIPLPNLGNTCYMNSALQTLLAIEPITSLLVSEPNPYPADSLAYAYVNFVQAIHALPAQNDAAYKGALKALQNNQLKKLAAKTRQIMGGDCRQADSMEYLENIVKSLIGENPAYKDIPEQQQFTQTPIGKIIHIKMRSELTCPDLPFLLEFLEKNVITLPIPTEGEKTFATILDTFFSPQTLGGSMPVPGYPDQENCKDQLYITLSDFFILRLSRFKPEEPTAPAPPHVVEIPMFVSFEKYMPIERKSSDVYELISFIKHRGPEPTSGHYVGYVKQREWYECNDDDISTKSTATIQKLVNDSLKIGTGVVLIYKKTR